MTSDAASANNLSTGKPNDKQLDCDNWISERFADATIIWGLLASLAGLSVALSMLRPELRSMFGSAGEYLSYGRIRPVFTSLAIYGFAANAAFTAIYYTTQRLCKRRMFSDLLGQLHLVSWQLIVVFSAFSIPRGLTQGQPLAESEWPLDVAFAVVWIVFFGINFMMTIAKRREKQLYISLWFFIATVVSVGVYQFGNFLITNIEGWRSDSLLAGTSDALWQSVVSHNTITLILTMPFLGLIYYFAPKMSGRPIYSYKLAIAQFWGMVLFFWWVGPAQLHLTAAPDIVSSLAMVFGLMLWMPLWGGVINGLLTVQGNNPDTERSFTDLVALKFLALGIGFLGLTTFFSSLLCIKSVSAVLNYTDWGTAQLDASVFASCGLLALGMIYWLASRQFKERPLNRAMVNGHFYLATIGVLLIVVPGYAAGLWQGLTLSSLSPETGMLSEPEFIKSLEQVAALRWLKLIGFGVFALGMAIMAINYSLAETAAMGKSVPKHLGGATSEEPKIVRGTSPLADAPMLEFAKSFDVWRRLDWHRVWERSAGRFVWLPLIVIAIATIVQVLPSILLPSEPIAQAYTPLELAGRQIFREEGCVNCHTKMVRATVPETKRFGDLSQAGEFAFDHSSQWGSRRVGPDLAREGGKRTSHWHWVHLADPRDDDWGEPSSVMPSFAHLAEQELDYDAMAQQVERATKLGATYAFDEDDEEQSMKFLVKQQAEAIAADIVAGGGPIWTQRYRREPLMVYDSQAVALIAYLQRLGTDLYRPVTTPEPQTAN